MRDEGIRSMTGRTVMVTGATGGIGRATAVRLAEMGADLVITGRDGGRVATVGREVRAAGGGSVVAVVADLSVQSDVRRLAEQVLHEVGPLHVLVNNVGGYWNTRHVTADGLEHTFAVNHLAPFLLTGLLLERLVQSGPARVVTVASNAQALGRVDFDDLQGTRSYSGARAYNQSKLANVLFAYELARRLRDTTVTSNALHPGVVSTSFGASDPGTAQRLLVPLVRPFMASARTGANTSVVLSSDPTLDRVSGRFFVAGSPRRSSRRSYDHEVAARLWDVSATLTGL